MVRTARGRKGDSAGITTRELGCRSHKKCKKCKGGARDLEENREHNSIEHR